MTAVSSIITYYLNKEDFIMERFDTLLEAAEFFGNTLHKLEFCHFK